MKFETSSADFYVTFIVSTDISEPTLLYRSDDYYYPGGYSLTIVDDE